MPDRPVRVRFAPSPTGYFHVGGAKTALYNWIFARQHGGTFVLRIEDTDAERNKTEWIEGIQAAMTWIGIDWDEGPHFQSEAAPHHVELALRLAEQGDAYWCDCTRDAIDERAKGTGRPGYDGFCRDRALGPGDGRALRFRTPREGTTVVADLIRGDTSFENANLEDFVILRSNGSPMFLLANVVDDIDMGITHVIRGEEHLSNTPKALLIWTALNGGPVPTFAHVPILVNEKRQKLSKRRDPVALEGYRDEGYLPEAMRNFLMLLGWAPAGDEEIVDFDTVIMKEFRIEDVHSSPAFFDVVKLRALNGHYIRALPVAEFIRRCQPWLTDVNVWEPDAFDEAVFAAMAPLVQERVTVLSEVPGYVDFLFLEDPVIDQPSWDKAMKADAPSMLATTVEAFQAVEWNAEAIKAAVSAAGEALGLKLAKAQAPVRVAITGRSVGPPLFESIELLGRDRTLARLEAARARLAASV
ncbi:MAG: glutamyl-tRNA synthetase [Acidimicrobiia bacterium]|nr:glutamyl-tRNA synthetase [Acidimicrobiia bacterium]